MLAAAAMRNEIFAQIVRTQYHKTDGDVLHTLKNKNRLLWEYEGGVGVKTGYTKAAGKCLVFAAERGGMLLIGAVLNCPSMWDTAKTMLDGGFSAYRAVQYLDQRTEFTIPVQNGVKKALSAAPIFSILYPTKSDGDGAYEVRTVFCTPLTAPVYEGAEVGAATLYRDGEPVLTVPVTARETVPAVGFSYFFHKAVGDYIA